MSKDTIVIREVATLREVKRISVTHSQLDTFITGLDRKLGPNYLASIIYGDGNGPTPRDFGDDESLDGLSGGECWPQRED
jgi:hypothetical protein